MRKCPSCGANYNILDAVCEKCGADLPAPYENIPEAHDDDYFASTEELSGESAQAAAQEGAKPTLGDGTVWQIAGQARYKPEETTILSGAEVFLGDGESINPATLILAHGRIVGLVEEAVADPQDGSTFIDLSGHIIAPGFIDVHVHGLMGIDTNQAGTDDFQRLSVEAAKFGITSLVPTTVACPLEELSRVLINFHAAREQGTAGARLLGLHMESNFISPQYKGAQPPEQIFSPEDQQSWPIKQLIDEYANDIRIVTLAPEVPGALEFIPWLRERNIIASIGHSAATYEQASDAIDAGATHATHLFNAMTPLHHRAPGMVGAALERDEVFTEIVCDGIHVHPAVISVVISAKGADRVMVVSDGLQGAGTDAGEFYLGGQRVSVRDGVAWLDNGTIAGSIITMDGIVRVLVDQVGWDLGEALMMASTTPADSLGITQLGRIVPDAVADLVVLDEALEVLITIIEGRIVYQR